MAEELCTDHYLWKISQNIHPADHRSLAIKLEFNEEQFEIIKHDVLLKHDGTEEIPYQILLKWKRENGISATKDKVNNAITEIKAERAKKERSKKGWVILVSVVFFSLIAIMPIFFCPFACKEPEAALEMPQSYENMTGQFSILQREFDSTGFKESSSVLKKLREDIIRIQRRIYIDIVLPQPPWLNNKILLLENLHINLELYNKGSYVRTEAISVILEEMFQYNRHNGEGKPLRILIEGPPGIGKSTLCRKLLNDWGLKKKYLRPKFKMVFLFELRHLQESDSIETAFVQECQGFIYSSEEVLKCIVKYQNETLLILDGFDEISDKHKRLLLPLLQKKVLPSMYVIITSRNGMFKMEQSTSTHIGAMQRSEHDFDKLDYFNKKVVIKGLKREEIGIFIDKYFDNDSEALKRKVFSACDKEMKEICEYPLFLLLLSSLLHEETLKILDSKTSLYKEFFNFIIRRNLIRERIIDVDNTIDIFSESVNSNDPLRLSLKCFGRYGLQSLIKHQISMEEKDILENCKNEVVLKLGFLVHNSKYEKHYKKIFYQPIHKSFLEFLSAFYAYCVLIDEGEEKFIGEIRRIGKEGFLPTDDSLFYVFLGGLLNSRATRLFEALLPFSHWFNLENICFTNTLLEIQDIDSFFDSFQIFLPYFVPNYYSIGEETDISTTFLTSKIHSLILNRSMKSKFIKILQWHAQHMLDFSDVYTVDYLILYLRSLSLSDKILKVIDRNIFLRCRVLSVHIRGHLTTDFWPNLFQLIDTIQKDKIEFVFLDINVNSDGSTFISFYKQLMDGHWKERTIDRLRLDMGGESDLISVRQLSELVKYGKINDGICVIVNEVNRSQEVKEEIKQEFEVLFKVAIESKGIYDIFIVNDDSSFSPDLDLNHFNKAEDHKFRSVFVRGHFTILKSSFFSFLYKKHSVEEVLSGNNGGEENNLRFIQKFQDIKFLGCRLPTLISFVENSFQELEKIEELLVTLNESFKINNYISQLINLKVLTLQMAKSEWTQQENDMTFIQLFSSLPLRIIQLWGVRSISILESFIDSVEEGLNVRQTNSKASASKGFLMEEIIVHPFPLELSTLNFTKLIGSSTIKKIHSMLLRKKLGRFCWRIEERSQKINLLQQPLFPWEDGFRFAIEPDGMNPMSPRLNQFYFRWMLFEYKDKCCVSVG